MQSVGQAGAVAHAQGDLRPVEVLQVAQAHDADEPLVRQGGDIEHGFGQDLFHFPRQAADLLVLVRRVGQELLHPGHVGGGADGDLLQGEGEGGRQVPQGRSPRLPPEDLPAELVRPAEILTDGHSRSTTFRTIRMIRRPSMPVRRRKYSERKKDSTSACFRRAAGPERRRAAA